jgi:hypothetical protein
MSSGYYRRSSGGGLYDMSSYVAVAGTPQVDSCCVFGLTPQEVRYLKVRQVMLYMMVSDCLGDTVSQGKFQMSLSNSDGQSSPHHGVRVEVGFWLLVLFTPPGPQATTIVVLNALGYIGFKVIATSGDMKVPPAL